MTLTQRAATITSLALATPVNRALTALLWLGLFNPFRPLLLPDEAKYTDIARWMARSGDFLIPRIDGLPFLHIPPLTYWTEALAIGAFGPSLLVARLTALAAGLLLTHLLYGMTERYAGPHAARWTFIASLTSPLFFGAAQFANMDLAVTALITLSIECALQAGVSATPSARRNLAIAAWGAAGLAVLAKGLIGFAVPAAVLVASALLLRRPRLLHTLASPLGLLLFLTLCLPWFLAVEEAVPGFLRYWFQYSYVEPYVTPNASHIIGAWFYPAVLLIGLAPWSIGALHETWRAWRVSSACRDGARELPAIALVWLAIVVIGQSLSAVKHPGLILPALPPALLLIGPLIAGAQNPLLGRVPTALIAAGLCLGLGLGATIATKTGPVELARQVRFAIGPPDRVVFVGRYLFDAAIVLDRAAPAFVVDDWTTPPNRLPDSLKRQLAEGRAFDPAAGGSLVEGRDLDRLLAPPGHAFVFIEAASADDFARAHGLRVITRNRAFAVLTANP